MMKSTRQKRTKFQEQFEDSQANYSEVNQANGAEQDGGEPIQLLKIERNGKIEINEDALNLIAQYNSPVGFVCLVGKARTGKSCLLNRLLQLKGKGFKVDPSVTSCTQGIWMWSEPRFNPQQNNYIFFLDTQGTDSLQKDFQNDTKIFTLALLISSYFMYNSVGSIDERSLGELQMVTALSKTIKADSKLTERDNNDNLHRFMPKFLWILRDFTLKIEDQRGRKISPTQYLENCLEQPTYGEKLSEDSRKIKKSLINYFKDRQCITLVRPVGQQSQLQRMNDIPDYSLRKQFVDGVSRLRNTIFKSAGPKTYEGTPLTGQQIAIMIQNYVESFNSQRIPNIKSAWQQIAEDQGAAAYNRALQKFQEIFKQEFPDDTPKGQEIYLILSRLRQQTIKQFQNNSYGNINQQYLKKLKQLLKQKQSNIIAINNNVNQATNHQILKNVSQKLKMKFQSGKYKGKKDQMTNDLNELVRNYNSQAKGQKKGEILTEFITNLTQLISTVDVRDNNEQQQQAKQAKLRQEELQKKLRLQAEQLESMKKRLQSEQDASKIKTSAGVKPDPKTDPKRKERDGNAGCCSGDKCQIM